MPYLFVRNYEVDLMDMNPDLYHVYVESSRGEGGDRKLVYIRQSQRGLPMCLRENYSETGTLSFQTEKRDILHLESELYKISRVSQSGANVCVPLIHLTNELSILEKQSPKVAGYVLKRMGSIGMQL
jgi:hypothetical protein